MRYATSTDIDELKQEIKQLLLVVENLESKIENHTKNGSIHKPVYGVCAGIPGTPGCPGGTFMADDSGKPDEEVPYGLHGPLGAISTGER